jgi:hypothetical protein
MSSRSSASSRSAAPLEEKRWPGPRQSLRRDVAAGLAWLWRQPFLRAALLLVIAVGLPWVYAALIPALAVAPVRCVLDVLGSTPAIFSFAGIALAIAFAGAASPALRALPGAGRS